MKRRLRFTDKLDIKSVKIIDDEAQKKEILDSFGITDPKPIVIKVAATHSGLLTRNNTYYTPANMKASVHTWTQDYGKPILTHHSGSDSDAIGRVIDAKYVDTSGKIDLNLKNSIFKDSKQLQDDFALFVEGNMPFLRQVDFITDSMVNLNDDPNFQGLGYIELTAVISDSEAIQKIKDGRYLTGSVSASTDKAVCSVCKQDWIDEGKCDHSPGKLYDKKKAFIIAGQFEYEEWSYVNDPADRFSQNLELVSDEVSATLKTDETVTDAITITSHADRKMVIQSHDSLHYQYDFDVAMALRRKREGGGDLEGTPTTSLPPKAIYDLHEKLHAEAKDGAFDDMLVLGAMDQALPKNLLPPVKEFGTEDSNKENTLTMSDNQTKDGTTSTEENVDATQVAEVTLDATSEGDLGTEGDPAGEPATEPETYTLFSKLTDEALETKLEELVIKDSAEGEEGEITDEQAELIYELMVRELGLEDAKLTTKKRKALATSTFCGPGRSFPVPDCAHVTAARRLIGRAKVGSSTKASILACVSRKAKSLGCSVKTNDATDETNVQIPVACPQCATDIKAIEDAALTQVTTLQTEIDLHKDHLEALRQEVSMLYGDYEAMHDKLVESEKEVRRLKAEKVVDFKLLSGDSIEDTTKAITVLTQLEDNALNSQVESVDMKKIVDRLDSGLSGSPSGTVSNPAATIQDAAALENGKSNQASDEDKKNADIRRNYHNMLSSKGHKTANKYLTRLVKDGYLDAGQAEKLATGGSR